MKDILVIVVIALLVVIVGHTATEGRRGRRWGGN